MLKNFDGFQETKINCNERRTILMENIKNNPKVVILVLNYNGWKYAIECLESIYRITHPNWEIMFVDNGSEDDSVLKIKEWAEGKIPVKSKFFEYAGRKPLKYVEELIYDEKEARVKGTKKEKEVNILPSYQKLSILRLEKNHGFAKGANIGMDYFLREKKADYIMLLNNDVVVDKEFLSELVKAAESDKKIGIIQPKMLIMDNPRIINSTGHVFRFGKIVDRGRGVVDKGQYDDKLNIIGACAGACLYKREMLESIGLFDKNFFMYYEDAELSWRAYKRGWKGRFTPSAIVYHKVRAATRKDKKLIKETNQICLRNMSITVGRHGAFYQKLLFSIFLFYAGIKSEIGKRIGIDTLGAKPHFQGLQNLWKLKNTG